ncbi:MAG: hypothetical protein K6L76_04885 [Agarilytica sp.]
MLLKSQGLPWLLSSLLPFVLLYFYFDEVKACLQNLRAALRYLWNIPFLIWLVVQVLLGVSLFNVNDGVRTPWVNNYGDLTFHLGMISHFTWQGDFLPEYHIFSGESLSYPFFVNLWSTVLWRPLPSFPALSAVFAAQWVLLWSVVYAVLVQKRGFFLPWLLLLGGGSLIAVFTKPEYSWRLINEGYPWTTWLSTVWVTQRSALMGLAVCTAAAGLVFNLPKFESHGRVHYAFAGALLAFTPLVHTHFFVVTSLFLGGYLFLIAIVKYRQHSLQIQEFSWSSFCSLESSQKFLVLFFFTCISIVFFPVLLGKSGMASLMLGWSVPVTPAGLNSIATSFIMWMKNAWPWAAVMLFIWWVTRAHLRCALLVGLFLLGNILKLATWDWDQLKFFIAIFALMLVLWSDALEKLKVERLGQIKQFIPHALFALLLMIPGTIELFKVVKEGGDYQVYNSMRIELAALVRNNTEPEDIIASPDDHNSAATLSGRSLFYGYPGTLASHNLNYHDREVIQKDISKIQKCFNLLKDNKQECPSYIVWGESARKYWHRVKPNNGYEEVAKTANGEFGLYRVGESK